VGVGMITAVLPLISPEKGAQLGFVAQGLLLVVSGVYYPIEVMPGWMQAIATISPATYALDGIRAAVLDGAGAGAVWHNLWPLLVSARTSVPWPPWQTTRSHRGIVRAYDSHGTSTALAGTSTGPAPGATAITRTGSSASPSSAARSRRWPRSCAVDGAIRTTG